eukprot:4063639-Heterocapsa_arctica.AAC.1
MQVTSPPPELNVGEAVVNIDLGNKSECLFHKARGPPLTMFINIEIRGRRGRLHRHAEPDGCLFHKH